MSTLIKELLNVVAPASCVGCGQWDTTLCPSCESIALREAIAGFIDGQFPMRLLSLGPYSTALRRIILTAKHDSAHNLTDWLILAGESLGRGWIEHRTVVDRTVANTPVLVVPAPSSWVRAWRGLMVTPSIAQGFAKALVDEGIDAAVAPILSKSWWVSQAGKTGSQRRGRQHSYISALVNVRGANCVVVDDVVTTGTTMHECRKAIEKASGHCFVGVALAHVPRGSRDGAH